jgi:DNA-binding LacI/PurR family transcriptional regulator
VSRVLNDSPVVSEDARRRVHRAIEELNYRRSSTARRLSTGGAQTIGVAAPFLASSSVVERLRGVVERLREWGEHDLLMFDVETLSERAEAFRTFARSDRIDGLLVISLRPTDAEVELLQREGMPIVLIDVDHPAFAHVMTDNVHGGELATQHLLDRGHTKIGFVGDARTPFGFTSSQQRREGMSLALRRAGIQPTQTLDERGAHGRLEAQRLAVRLLRLKDRPTAIFAATDLQAMGVLEAARDMKLRVPEDLAVIGFDDIEAAGALGLTTVRQPLRESGTQGAELLLSAIEGIDGGPAEELTPLAVIQRRTT